MPREVVYYEERFHSLLSSYSREVQDGADVSSSGTSDELVGAYDDTSVSRRSRAEYICAVMSTELLSYCSVADETS